MENEEKLLTGESVYFLDLNKIEPNPYQPRIDFDEDKLEALADSIKQYGVLQPIVVTKKEEYVEGEGIKEKYQIIAGERRFRASRLAGLTKIPAIIREGASTDSEKLELAIIENLQREDLNPVDKAKAFKKLAEEFGLTHADIAKKMGKSREYVSNAMRILALPEHILSGLKKGLISEGHTRSLLMLKDKPEEQEELYKRIIQDKLTVRSADTLARSIASDKVRKKVDLDPEIKKIEKKIREKLGTKVSIDQKSIGDGGKLTIEFFSKDDLRKIIEAFDKADSDVKTDASEEENELDNVSLEVDIEKHEPVLFKDEIEKVSTQEIPENVEENVEENQEKTSNIIEDNNFSVEKKVDDFNSDILEKEKKQNFVSEELENKVKENVLEENKEVLEKKKDELDNEKINEEDSEDFKPFVIDGSGEIVENVSHNELEELENETKNILEDLEQKNIEAEKENQILETESKEGNLEFDADMSLADDLKTINNVSLEKDNTLEQEEEIHLDPLFSQPKKEEKNIVESSESIHNFEIKKDGFDVPNNNEFEAKNIDNVLNQNNDFVKEAKEEKDFVEKNNFENKVTVEKKEEKNFDIPEAKNDFSAEALNSIKNEDDKISDFSGFKSEHTDEILKEIQENLKKVKNEEVFEKSQQSEEDRLKTEEKVAEFSSVTDNLNNKFNLGLDNNFSQDLNVNKKDEIVDKDFDGAVETDKLVENKFDSLEKQEFQQAPVQESQAQKNIQIGEEKKQGLDAIEKDYDFDELYKSFKKSKETANSGYIDEEEDKLKKEEFVDSQISVDVNNQDGFVNAGGTKTIDMSQGFDVKADEVAKPKEFVTPELNQNMENLNSNQNTDFDKEMEVVEEKAENLENKYKSLLQNPTDLAGSKNVIEEQVVEEEPKKKGFFARLFGK